MVQPTFQSKRKNQRNQTLPQKQFQETFQKHAGFTNFSTVIILKYHTAASRISFHHTTTRSLMQMTHNHTFKYEEKKTSTELSNYVWDLQLKDINPSLTWSVIDHDRPYVNGSKRCNLICLTEKFHIITSELDLVNKRSELISKCRHSNKFVLKNFKNASHRTKHNKYIFIALQYSLYCF